MPRSSVALTWMAENGVVSAGPSALTEPGGAGAGVAMAGGLRGSSALRVTGGVVS